MISEVPEGTMNIHEGFSYCRNLDEDGYTDWYLPSIEEILEIQSGLYGDTGIEEINNYISTRSTERYASTSYIYIKYNPGDSDLSYTNSSSGNSILCIQKD